MSQASQKTWPPAYFRREGETFQPTGLARSPWDRGAVAGGPISGLLATCAEDPELDGSFAIARLTIDILGKVPFGALAAKTETLRDGRQTKLHRISLLSDQQLVAQAHALRIRKCDAPGFPVAHDYPPPQTVFDTGPGNSPTMAGGIEYRRVLGDVGLPGRGIAWMGISGEIVAGLPASSFVKAALIADFGGGLGNATPSSAWSYANLDITLQFLRMPVGKWMLLDATTHSEGNGHATAESTFADEFGVYARGFQTVFVAPGHLSVNLPRSGKGRE